MQIAMPIHSDAMCHQFQVRRSGETGNRSSFASCVRAGSVISPRPSARSMRLAAVVDV